MYFVLKPTTQEEAVKMSSQSSRVTRKMWLWHDYVIVLICIAGILICILSPWSLIIVFVLYLVTPLNEAAACCLLCLGVHAPKTYGIYIVGLCMCVCICVCMYVCNSHFPKVAKNQALPNAIQAQYDNITNLIVLDLNKEFVHYYGVICLS